MGLRTARGGRVCGLGARDLGKNAQWAAAYRRWYEAEMERHDQLMLHMMEEFDKRAGSASP